jgi:hypothetical protein
MTLLTMNCAHDHYAGQCENRHCTCQCHPIRIGSVFRTEREWEIWKDRGKWKAWHPGLTGLDLLEASYESQSDAVDAACIYERLHADRLEQWRAGRK